MFTVNLNLKNFVSIFIYNTISDVNFKLSAKIGVQTIVFEF